MHRHQLLVTPPQPAGRRVKRDGGGGGMAVWKGLQRVGGERGLGKSVKECEWWNRAGITSAVISFVYKPF